MEKALKLAEVLDAHRVMPRIIFALISVFVLWYTWYVTDWYFGNFERLSNNSAAMFGSSGFLAITIPAMFKFAITYATEYLKGGVDWGNKYSYHPELSAKPSGKEK